ncbi:variable surface protein [Plasmodium gonderi]|uniref:Variable surface protein n=1 Tax=Plasmodium gonderi TaxID=77519 RepID=A0A1Y1JVS1_PLAGO|nr:variable surface protein [Plasmodium gonderi]GAW83984.1 variable surface protein [Plasmodium gonderi]
MDKFNYELVKEFPKHNENLKNNDLIRGLEYKYCFPNGGIGGYNNIYLKFSEDRCMKALSFASRIKPNYNIEYGYWEEANCFFLYYWLHNEFNANGISQYTSNIYKALFNALHKNSNNICRYYKYKVILEEEFTKLNNLYDIYKKIQCIENSCSTCKNKCDCINECSNKYESYNKTCNSSRECSYCEALNNIKNEFINLQKLNHDCFNVKHKELHSKKIERKNITSTRISKRKTAIISTILILIIPALLFIIYKFLPYNSCLYRKIKKIINRCPGFTEEWRKTENSEIYNNIFCNSNYNVLYSSHYIDD